MPWRHSIALVGLLAFTAAEADGQDGPATATVVRVSSGTPGHEVGIRGVMLVRGRPMQVVEHITPFELRADRPLVLPPSSRPTALALLEQPLGSRRAVAGLSATFAG
jgi:hypothetical protein